MSNLDEFVLEASKRIKLHKEKENNWVLERLKLQNEISELIGEKAAWNFCKSEMDKKINKLRKQIFDIKGKVETNEFIIPVFNQPETKVKLNNIDVNTEEIKIENKTNPIEIPNNNKPSIIESPKKIIRKSKKTSSGKPAVLKYSISIHLDSIRALSFYNSQPIVISASDDGTIRLTNVEPMSSTGKKLRNPINFYSLRGHSTPILSLFSYEIKDKQYLISGALDGSIAIWELPSINSSLYDIKGLVHRCKAYDYYFHKEPVWCVSSNGINGLSVSSDRTAKFWRIAQDPNPITLPIEGTPVCCKFFKNNNFIIVTLEGNIFIFEDQILISKYLIDSSILSITDVTDNNLFYLSTNDGRIRSFDIEQGKIIDEFVVSQKGISSVSLTSDFECLITTGLDKEIRVWSTENYNILF